MTDINFSRISSTALPCAHIRAKYTDIPFAKEIYKAAKKKGAKENLTISFMIDKIAPHNPSTRTQISIIEGRYTTTNEAIPSYKNPVILEIASGLSTRGLEYANKGIQYVETDLPEMIRLKEGLIKKITQNNTPQNHHFRSLNALDINALMRTGEYIRQISPDSPITIVQEGLLMYLTKDEKKILRDNIYKFLKKYSPNGNWVTTDLSSRKLSKVKGDLLSKIAMRIISRNTKREFQRFNNDNEVTQFLHKGNLDGAPLPNKAISRNLSCRRKIKISDTLIDKVSNRYRAWIIHL